MSEKNKMLTVLANLYSDANGCKLNYSRSVKLKGSISMVADHFSVSNDQALLIGVILGLNLQGDDATYGDLISYLECNPVKILGFKKSLDDLCGRKILVKESAKYGRKSRGFNKNDKYSIRSEIIEAIIHERPIAEATSAKHKNIADLLEEIHETGRRKYDGEISTDEMYDIVVTTVTSNMQFPLMRMMEKYVVEDIVTYLHMVWKIYQGKGGLNLSNFLDAMMDDPTTRMAYSEAISNGSNDLIKEGIIEFETGGFCNDITLNFTGSTCKMLQEMGLVDDDNLIERDRRIIEASEITDCNLLYNEEEKQQINTLQELLSDEKLDTIRNKLAARGLKQGIAIMLHGSPGTGKTETALQLARMTGRHVFKVDISQGKSKWFGESERITKQIFTDYSKFTAKCRKIPILLFNEADALFSKRKENTDSSVGQTENSIQNIFLDELENFDGVLIATTNLVQNLDKAFERRFLYKIELKKPGDAQRTGIWHTKMPWLDLSDCWILAEKFDFSGGQIDNIVRKAEIFEITNDSPPTLPHISNMCEEELLEKKERKRIGF